MTDVAHTTVAAPWRVRARDFAAVIVSEWTKLRSVRSSWWSLLTVVAGTIGFGVVITASVAARWPSMTAAQRAGFDPTFKSLSGLFIAQLAVGVLGVLVITSEYASGTIRTTFAAVPRRRVVFTAKIAALAGPTLVASVIAVFVAFLSGQAILATRHAGVSLGQPNELRAVIGGALYLVMLALLALGLGGIFRRSAGGIAGFVALVLIAPVISSTLPEPWRRDISMVLPGDAGQALLNVTNDPNMLHPWTGGAVEAAWALAALACAAWLVNRRDV
jgi:ABC-2 type transport system permease protein